MKLSEDNSESRSASSDGVLSSKSAVMHPRYRIIPPYVSTTPSLQPANMVHQLKKVSSPRSSSSIVSSDSTLSLESGTETQPPVVLSTLSTDAFANKDASHSPEHPSTALFVPADSLHINSDEQMDSNQLGMNEIPLTSSLDLTTLVSIYPTIRLVNLKNLINRETFLRFPILAQKMLLSLLPGCDSLLASSSNHHKSMPGLQLDCDSPYFKKLSSFEMVEAKESSSIFELCHISQGLIHPTALNNEFFNKSLEDFKDRLEMGEWLKPSGLSPHTTRQSTKREKKTKVFVSKVHEIVSKKRLRNPRFSTSTVKSTPKIALECHKLKSHNDSLLAATSLVPDHKMDMENAENQNNVSLKNASTSSNQSVLKSVEVSSEIGSLKRKRNKSVDSAVLETPSAINSKKVGNPIS